MGYEVTLLKERVLVLDDEPVMLSVLGRYLAALEHDYLAFESPLAALECLASNTFSLLVTDLRMPEMHGMEVVRRAKQRDPDMAIIVVTGLGDVNQAIESIHNGADDYVVKPFSFGDIAMAISKALDKRARVIEARNYSHDLESRVQSATEQLEQANAELRRTKEYLENLLHSTVDAIITVDKCGKVEFANEGAVDMLAPERRELVGRPAAEFFQGGTDELRIIRRRLREERRIKNCEAELRRDDGTLVHVSMSLSLVPSGDGTVVSALAVCKDITDQKRLEAELKEMSIKDSLTTLYNQRYFYDMLRSEIERARRQNHPLSLLLLDIDQFKSYNDGHGHLEGDRVLQTVGKVILECTRIHVDAGFRYGGDEFTVVLPEADEAQALQIAERIRRSFEAKRFDRLTLSIGLKTHREGDSVRSFIHFADAMMYDAKRSGGNSVYVYRPEEGEAVTQTETETETETKEESDVT